MTAPIRSDVQCVLWSFRLPIDRATLCIIYVWDVPAWCPHMGIPSMELLDGMQRLYGLKLFEGQGWMIWSVFDSNYMMTELLALGMQGVRPMFRDGSCRMTCADNQC